MPNNFKPPKTPEEMAIAQQKDKEDKALQAKNLARKNMKRLPLLTTSPIRVDLSRIDPKFLASDLTKKAIYPLLGWTSVKQSKKMYTKDGREFTRKAHDRRIRADVDRRDVSREITSREPSVIIEAVDGRPKRVRKDRMSTGVEDNAL